MIEELNTLPKHQQLGTKLNKNCNDMSKYIVVELGDGDEQKKKEINE